MTDKRIHEELNNSAPMGLIRYGPHATGQPLGGLSVFPGKELDPDAEAEQVAAHGEGVPFPNDRQSWTNLCRDLCFGMVREVDSFTLAIDDLPSEDFPDAMQTDLAEIVVALNRVRAICKGEHNEPGNSEE